MLVFHHAGAHDRVERGEWLVHQQEPRFHRQHLRQRHALALAAAQAAGKAVAEAREIEPLEPGVRLGERQGRPTVVAVLPDTPAQKGGLRPGDGLLKVDGKEVKEKSVAQIVEMVAGKADTEVQLTVSREGETEPVTLTLTRAEIKVPDVSWHMLQGRPVAHVGIQQFGQNADDDLRKAIEAARQQGARGLVLDAAARRDAAEPCIKEASMAKLFASEMAERVASDAIQIHGGYGYVADYPVERIYRDVRVCQIYEGTSDIQRLVIAREIAKD